MSRLNVNNISPRTTGDNLSVGSSMSITGSITASGDMSILGFPSVSSSLASIGGDAALLELSASIHDVFTTGSCNTGILPKNGTGNCITGNNVNTFIAGVCDATVTATQGLSNTIVGARSSKICGNLVSDSAIIGTNAGCLQGNVGTSIIAGGSSNLIGGTQTGGGRAGNAAIIGAQNSFIGNSGTNTNPGPNASVILGGFGHCIETSFAAPTNAIGYVAILGGYNHTINTEDVLRSAIIGGCNSTVTTSDTVVLGSDLTGNVADHTFVDGLNVKGSVTASSTSIISGSKQVHSMTGSFADLQGHSPINVSSEINFRQPATFSQPVNFSTGSLTITGSLTVSGSGTWNNIGPLNQTGVSTFTGDITASANISASGEVTSAGFNTHVTPVASVDNTVFVANGRKVEVKNALQSSLADGDFARFELMNTSITTSSIVLGAFVGNTAGPITGSIITVATTSSGGGHIQFHNETGQTIADDTAWTASFIVL